MDSSQLMERKKYKLHVRVMLCKYRGYAGCPECQGSGCAPKRVRCARWAEHLPGRGADHRARAAVLRRAQADAEQEEIAGSILEEVQQRLRFLDAVGLEYLTLDRLASTLSGGEAQRIQLATSLGSQLVGALYVLDEPSIGLHTRDTAKLIRILEEPARSGQHHPGGRARSRCPALRRLICSTSGPARASWRQAAGRRALCEQIEAQSQLADRPLSLRAALHSGAHAAARAGARKAGAARRADPQSARSRCRDSAGHAGRDHRRFRLGQIDAGAPGAVSRRGACTGADGGRRSLGPLSRAHAEWSG